MHWLYTGCTAGKSAKDERLSTLTEADQKEFEKQILKELQSLDEADALGSDDQKTVQLDQQSVGRLSRMDALQRQALAQATKRRRDARRLRISAALARLKDSEFGYCEDCGEPIPVPRLALDPATPKCVQCANG